MMTMKQIIFGSVLALLLFGFFVEQTFAQETGTNGGIAAGGTNGAKAGNGGVSTSGNTTNGKNGANANGGDNVGNTTGLAVPGED
jgi:hypothetical protein